MVCNQQISARSIELKMQICSPSRTSRALPSVTSAQVLLKVIRVEGPLNFSEDLKHLSLDQILFC